MPLPPELLFHPEHLWVRSLPDGSALVGISRYAAERLGEVVYVDYPPPGTAIVQGVPFGTIESSKVVSDLVAPISGQVLETSEGSEDAVAHLNADPEGAGWLLRITPIDDAQAQALMSTSSYRSRLGEQA